MRIQKDVPQRRRSVYDSEEQLKEMGANKTKTKEREAWLEKKDMFSALIQNSSDMISILKPDGTIYYESPSVERLLGYSPDELIGRNAFEMIHSEDLPRVLDAFNEILQDHELSLSVKFRYKHKNGLWRVIESTGSNQLHNPVIAGIVVNSRDVTEQHQVEEKLRESEEKYRLLFEKESDAIVLFDSETLQMLDVNDAFVKLYGYSREEIAGIKATDLSAEPENTLASIRKTAIEGSDHVPLRWHKKKDGTVFPLEISAGSFTLRGRGVICAIVKDITEHKTAEEGLRLFSQAIDEAMDGVQITDLDGYIVYSNKAIEEIYGFSLNDFRGRHVSELNADKEFAGKVIIPSIRETGRWNGELMVLHKEGREFPIWLSASIVKDSGGEPIAMVGIVRDMTAHKSAEEWKENLIHKLNDAFAKIKTLRGLLPICAWCKKIRNDRGYWQKVETYIKEHSDASFTHCICPECLKQVSPETYDEVLRERSELLGGSHPDKG